MAVASLALTLSTQSYSVVNTVAVEFHKSMVTYVCWLLLVRILDLPCSDFLTHTVWGKLRWSNPQGTRGGFWVGAMLTLAVKPQWVRCKLDETIEQSCSNFLTHTLEVCKSVHRYNEYSAIRG
jgi:hypothetical protein